MFSLVLGKDWDATDYALDGWTETGINVGLFTVENWCNETGFTYGDELYPNVNLQVNLLLTEMNCSWTGTWLC